MEQQKVDFFLMSKGECFPVETVPMIREKLLELDDSKAIMVQSVNYYNPLTMLIISIFVGELGVDRFMLGDVGLGILKLITLGGCGIWWLIDLINIQKMTRQYNYQQFMRYTI